MANMWNIKGYAHNKINKMLTQFERELEKAKESNPSIKYHNAYTKNQTQQQMYATILDQSKSANVPRVLTYKEAKSRIISKSGISVAKHFTQKFYKEQVTSLTKEFIESQRQTVKGNEAYYTRLGEDAITNIIYSENQSVSGLLDNIDYDRMRIDILVQNMTPEQKADYLSDRYAAFKDIMEGKDAEDIFNKYDLKNKYKEWSIGAAWKHFLYTQSFRNSLIEDLTELTGVNPTAEE